MICYRLFETAIGWAGIAWGDAGIVGAHLPEADPAIVRRAFARRFPGAEEASPTDGVAQVEAAVCALMRGEPADLSHALLDFARVPAFHAQVYEIARGIPAGQTLTYGEVAAQMGDRLLAQKVGEALGKNPWPILIPCHRVTAAGGKLGGFSARGGAQTKLKLLAIEGAKAAAQGDLFG